MSFAGMLFLTETPGDGSPTFTLLTADFSLNRSVDAHSRPNGGIRGGIIELTVETTRSNALTEWITNNNTINGSIYFARRESGDLSQYTVEFFNAFCISLKHSFISSGTGPMTTRITISAHQLIINETATITNTWAGVEPSASGSGSDGSSSGTESSTTTETGNSVTFD